MLGWLGRVIGVRKGWLVRCEWPPNCYRPRSMLATVIAAAGIVGSCIFLIVQFLYVVA